MLAYHTDPRELAKLKLEVRFFNLSSSVYGCPRKRVTCGHRNLSREKEVSVQKCILSVAGLRYTTAMEQRIYSKFYASAEKSLHFKAKGPKLNIGSLSKPPFPATLNV